MAFAISSTSGIEASKLPILDYLRKWLGDKFKLEHTPAMTDLC
jgi:hypothetical protein